MKLHEQVKALQAEKEVLVQGMNNLRRYLNSDKFHEDTTVQVADILHRMQEITNDLYDLEIQHGK